MSLVEKLNVKKSNEFETFELDGDYPNLIVSELENGVSCVHNVLTGDNFFNSKTIEKTLGLTKQKVSYHISKYEEFLTKSKKIGLSQEYSNSNKTDKIKLKIKNSDKPVSFYSFDVLTYIAYRVNTLEAISMRDWIQNALNEKFNNYHNIDLVDMKAKNERLKNKKQYDSLVIHIQTKDLNIALKNGHKEEIEVLKNSIQIYKQEFNRLDTLTKEVDRWIRDEELRRPRLNDIKNNELWSGGYDNCINPPTGFKFDRDGNYVMEANQSILKKTLE